MRSVVTWVGNAALLIVAIPLYLLMQLVFLPLVVIDYLVSLIRREPRDGPPSTGISLVKDEDGSPSPEAVADAVVSRCTTEVRRVMRQHGAIEVASAATAGMPVVVQFSNKEGCEEDVVVDVGPWRVIGLERPDNGEGDRAVAMAGAYLDHGLTCRVVKGRTIGLLRVDDPGFWWRARPEGEPFIRQTRYRDLPGRPAIASERAQWLELTQSERADSTL